jgi:hypothetical protein
MVSKRVLITVVGLREKNIHMYASAYAGAEKLDLSAGQTKKMRNHVAVSGAIVYGRYKGTLKNRDRKNVLMVNNLLDTVLLTPLHPLVDMSDEDILKYGALRKILDTKFKEAP